MSIHFKRGSFVANLATGNQVVNDVGFLPSVIILTSVGLTAVGDAVGPTGTAPMAGLGVATGTSERWAMAWSEQDNVAAGNTNGRYSSTHCFVLQQPTTNADALADLVSFDATGFTINWSDAPSVAVLIEYVAIGGSGVEAFAGTDQLRTTLGNESITGVGFQGKAMLSMSAGLHSPAPPALVSQMTMGLGVASSPTARGRVSLNEADGSNPSNLTVAQFERALGVVAGGVLDWHIDLVSFDADGFTYAVTDAPTGANADYWFYLILGGSELQAKVVNDTQKTSSGEKATTGVGFEPRALIGFSRQEPTAFDAVLSTTQAGRLCLGVRDETSEACIWHSAEDNASPTNVDRSHSQSKFFQFRDNARVVLAEADVASMDADGYTLDWTTADGTARHFITLALGGGEGGDSSTRLAMMP